MLEQGILVDWHEHPRAVVASSLSHHCQARKSSRQTAPRLILFVPLPYLHHPTPPEVTEDDVSAPVERLEIYLVHFFSSNESVRGWFGVFACVYETHWQGLL